MPSACSDFQRDKFLIILALDVGTQVLDCCLDYALHKPQYDTISSENAELLCQARAHKQLQRTRYLVSCFTLVYHTYHLIMSTEARQWSPIYFLTALEVAEQGVLLLFLSFSYLRVLSFYGYDNCYLVLLSNFHLVSIWLDCKGRHPLGFSIQKT